MTVTRTKKGTLAVTLVVMMILIFPSSGAFAKQLIGWLEKVALVEPAMVLHAKIDTGADHSSLNTSDYKIINIDDVKWIQFSVQNRDGDTAVLKTPLLRFSKIKRKNTPSQKRPVTNLGICIGNIYKVVEVNLVDRSNYKYQMLIGRSFLNGNSIVDSSLEYTISPSCKPE